MSEHADAIAAHAKAVQQLAVVKGIVDAGGGDFGREHKDLMVTGRESVNNLIDVFIGALKLVRRDEAEKRSLLTAQLGLFPDPHSEPTDVADLHRDDEPEEPAAAAGEIYWQVLKHGGNDDRYAVQVRPAEGDETDPQVIGFVKLEAGEEIEPKDLPGLEYAAEDTITIEFLNDPQEPLGVESRWGNDTVAEPEPAPEPKKKSAKSKKK